MNGYYSFYNELENMYICQALNDDPVVHIAALSFLTFGAKHLPGPLVAQWSDDGGRNPPNECWFELEDSLVKGKYFIALM